MDDKQQDQRPPTPAPELSRPFNRLQALARMGVVGVGLLYVIGLLILNLDLGRHGLISLDLARPEYVMVGALWAFLTALAWAATDVMIGNVKAIRSRGKAIRSRGGRTALFIFEAGTQIGISFFVLWGAIAFLTRYQVSTGKESLIPLLGVGVNALFLSATTRSFRAALSEERLSVGTLFQQTGRGTPIFWAMMMLSALGFYAVAVFPYLPREIGGGSRPEVELYVTADAPRIWEELGLTPSATGKVGPLILVLETSDRFVIKPTGSAMSFAFPVMRLPELEKKPVTGIDKRFVSAVVYRVRSGP